MTTKAAQKKRLAALHARVLAGANECLSQMFKALGDDDLRIVSLFGTDIDHLPEKLQDRARLALSRVDHSALSDSQFDLIIESEAIDEAFLQSVDEDLEKFFSENLYLED
jgi:hypothetical protein